MYVLNDICVKTKLSNYDVKRVPTKSYHLSFEYYTKLHSND